MKLSTAPWAVLLAATGLLLCNAPAAAQGAKGILPDPISSADIKAGAAEAGLTEAQLPGAFAALERYLADWKTLRDAEVAKFLIEWDSRPADASAEVQKAFADRRRGIYSRMSGLDAALVADLTALADPAQRAAVARLGDKWRRRAAFAIVSTRIGVRSPELTEVVAATDLTPEQRLAVDPALSAWEVSATPALERAARLQIDSVAVQAKARETAPTFVNGNDLRAHMEAVREHMAQANAEVIKANRALRKQYREAVTQMRAALPPEVSIRLLCESIDQAYFMLPDGDHERAFLANAYGLAKQPEQTNAIHQLENAWWSVYEPAINDWMDSKDEQVRPSGMFILEFSEKGDPRMAAELAHREKVEKASATLISEVNKVLGVDANSASPEGRVVTTVDGQTAVVGGTFEVTMAAPTAVSMAIEGDVVGAGGDFIAVAGAPVEMAVVTAELVNDGGGTFMISSDSFDMSDMTFSFSTGDGEPFDGFHGGGPGTIPLLTQDALHDQLAAMGAGEDGQAIAQALHEEYRAAGEKVIAEAEALRDSEGPGQGQLAANQVEPYYQARTNAFTTVEQLDQRLYGDIATTALPEGGDSAALRWHQSARRRELLRQGSAEPIRSGLGAVDLATAARETSLSDADRVQAERMLAEYPATLEAALRQREQQVSAAVRTIAAADAKMHEGWQRMNDAKPDANAQVAISFDEGDMRARMDAERNLNKANGDVSRFNIAELAKLDAAVSPEGRAALQMAWGRQAYPGTFKDKRRIVDAFDVALAAPGLSSAEAVTAIRSQYEQAYGAIMRQMVEIRHNAAVQRTDGDSGIILGAALPTAGGTDGPSPQAVQRQMDARIAQLRFERDELTDATWRRLTEAVGPEVTALLTAPPERAKKTR